jgi:hypothetical protein
MVEQADAARSSPEVPEGRHALHSLGSRAPKRIPLDGEDDHRLPEGGRLRGVGHRSG